MTDRPERRRSGGSPEPPPGPALSTLVLSLVGVIVSGYLGWTKLTGTPAVFCVSAGGCDIVQSSYHAVALGIPTAFWGTALYLVIAGLALRGFTPGRWLAALVASTAGVAFSAYLTAVSLFQLRAACPYCLASAVIMLAILADVLWRWRRIRGAREGLGPSRVLTWIGGTAEVTVLAAVAVFANAPDPASPYQAGLARHLAATRAVMYGAYWCPHCQEQKKLFDSAASALPYVECAPEGPNPHPDLCERAQVKSFPTWVIDGQRLVGVQSLDALARASGFKE